MKPGDKVLVKGTVRSVNDGQAWVAVACGPFSVPGTITVPVGEVVIPPKARPPGKGPLSDRQWIALDQLYEHGLLTPGVLARCMSTGTRMKKKDSRHSRVVMLGPVSVHSAGATMGSLIARGYAERLYGPRGLIRYGITMAGKKARDAESE